MNEDKNKIIIQLDELSKMKNNEKKIIEYKKLYFTKLAFYIKANLVWVYFFSFIIFYIKNNSEGNFFQIKYFYESITIVFFCFLIEIIFCLSKCFFNKDINIYYRKKSIKIAIEIFIFIFIIFILKILK